MMLDWFVFPSTINNISFQQHPSHRATTIRWRLYGMTAEVVSVN